MHNRFKNVHLTYNMREQALRIIMYFRFSGTYDYHKYLYTLLANIHYSSGNINTTQKVSSPLDKL